MISTLYRALKKGSLFSSVTQILIKSLQTIGNADAALIKLSSTAAAFKNITDSRQTYDENFVTLAQDINIYSAKYLQDMIKLSLQILVLYYKPNKSNMAHSERLIGD